MSKQKLWAVILKESKEIFDTSSIFFSKRSAEFWKKEEIEKYPDVERGTYKVVRIEINII